MKRLISLLVALLCGFAIHSASQAADKSFVTCASGTTGGGFYLLGSGMATILQRSIPGVIASNQATSGGAENVRLVGGGKATLGLAGGDQMYFAFRGQREYKEAYPDLRLVVGTYISPEHVGVKASSAIRSIGDLKGKKIVTTPGFNAGALTPAILKAFGLGPDDAKIVALGFSEAITAFKDGNVDAFFLATSAPHPLIKEAARSTDIRFIGFSEETVKKLLTEYPYWVAGTIPKGSYEGVNEDLHSLTSPVAWVTNAKVPDELVYEITKTVIEQNKEYAKIVKLGSEFNKENALKTFGMIPIHPGAEKYYKEIGLMK